ncbi:MAG: hypothetical protein ACFFG0_01440 [Candidatus Thorarchaeota archaeon]
MSYIREKLKEVFESVVESDCKYDGSIKNINYIDLFYKAASKRNLFKLMGNDVCMFSCEHEGKDAVLMVFYIPINSEETGAKNVAERVMQVVEEVESCFVTLDYLNSEEVKEDKFVYVVVVKCVC